MTTPRTPADRLAALLRRVFRDSHGPEAPAWNEDVHEWMAARLIDAGVGVPDEGLRAIVKRAAGMGLCSQTHHEHLMLDARAALASPAPTPRTCHITVDDAHPCTVCGAPFR